LSGEVKNAHPTESLGAQSKKKAPSEDGAYDLGPKSKSQVVASGEGGGYAFCRWIFAQGGGLGSDPVSQSRTEGGGNGAAHIDKYEYDGGHGCRQCGYKHASHAVCAGKVSMVDLFFCSFARERADARSVPARRDRVRQVGEGKNKAPLEGRAGPKLQA
jgi:hypothetical protein